MSKLSKATLNFIVDALGLLALMGMIATGLILKFRLLTGAQGGHGWSIWGLTRHEWGAIHFFLSLAFTVLIVLHLLLHWRWIWGFVSGRDPKKQTTRRTVFALITLALLLMVALPWLLPISKSGSSSPEHDAGFGNPAGAGKALALQSALEPEAPAPDALAGVAINLKGALTFSEAAGLTGLALPELLERLGLPADTPASERLGRTIRAKGLTMNDARQRLGLPAEDH